MVLASRVATESHFIIRLQCSPFHTHSALHPIFATCERSAGLTLAWTNGETRSIDRRSKARECGARNVALFADLLSIPSGIACPDTKRRPSR